MDGSDERTLALLRRTCRDILGHPWPYVWDLGSMLGGPPLLVRSKGTALTVLGLASNRVLQGDA